MLKTPTISKTPTVETSSSLSRREMMVSAATGAGVATMYGALPPSTFGTEQVDESVFKFCLNTSTVRGQTLSLLEQIELAAESGYDGIEPWIGDIEKYRASGGSLRDIGKRCEGLGLEIPSAIGFAEWIVNDPARRAKGLERARREMDLVRQIGGTRIAAPPVGATSKGYALDLLAAADRYAVLLEVGRQIGVVAQVEVWGFSENLSRLGEAVLVAIESGHPDACLLPDVYHIYKGGSDYAGLNLLGHQAIHCFHLNDYPANPRREELTDAHRIYPGDGVAPWNQVLAALAVNHNRCMLSLELFNPDYWKLDAMTVARTGLQKCQSVVERVLNHF